MCGHMIFYIVNIMVADILVPFISRPSTAMTMTLYISLVLVLHKNESQLPMSRQCDGMT